MLSKRRIYYLTKNHCCLMYGYYRYRGEGLVLLIILIILSYIYNLIKTFYTNYPFSFWVVLLIIFTAIIYLIIDDYIKNAKKNTVLDIPAKPADKKPVIVATENNLNSTPDGENLKSYPTQHKKNEIVQKRYQYHGTVASEPLVQVKNHCTSALNYDKNQKPHPKGWGMLGICPEPHSRFS